MDYAITDARMSIAVHFSWLPTTEINFRMKAKQGKGSV